MKGLEPLAPRSMHAELLDRIREYILVNHLQPGDHLPTEAQLAEQLRVSRAVVREAMRALESLGVVYSRRGEGRIVGDFTLDAIIDNLGYTMLSNLTEVGEMIDVRERLEVGFVPDAIAGLDEATLARMRELIAEIKRKAAANENFLEEDLAFHRSFYQATGNRLLTRLLEVFLNVYKRLRDESVRYTRDPLAEAQNHEDIFNALAASDVARTQQLIADHFQGIRNRLRTVSRTAQTDGGENLPRGG